MGWDPGNLVVGGTLSVNTGGSQSPGPTIGYFRIPAGASDGNGILLHSAGSAQNDWAFLRFQNNTAAGDAVKLEIWTDMSSGWSRVKSRGPLSLHAGASAGFTASGEVVTITPAAGVGLSGNVGINTTYPGAKLVVKSDDNSRWTPIIRTAALNESIGLSLGFDLITVGGSATYSDLRISSKGTGHLLFQAPQTGASGYVGIGLDSPQQLLHIQGAGSPSILVEAIPPYNNPALNLLSAGATGKVEVQGATKMVLSYNANANMEFVTGNAPQPQMVIQPGGNVGIGNVSPSYRLDVAGSVRATGAVDIGANLTVGTNMSVNGNVQIGLGLTSAKPIAANGLGNDGRVEARQFFALIGTGSSGKRIADENGCYYA